MTVCHWVSAYRCLKRPQCLLFQDKIAWPWKQRHCDPSKCQELLLHWQCVTSQKIWILIWHSKNRTSWHILVMKANKMHYFSTLFWERTLHVSDRITVHHQESFSSSSGPRTYAPDAPQTIRLLCDPEPPPPWFRHSHFRRQVHMTREILAAKDGTVGENVGR